MEATEGKSWLLSFEDSRNCDLSNNKSKTLTEIPKKYQENSEEIDSWVDLPESYTHFSQVGPYCGFTLDLSSKRLPIFRNFYNIFQEGNSLSSQDSEKFSPRRLLPT